MNLSSRLHAHLARGKVGFPTTLASSVGVIMASQPVILTVTSGFGIGGDTFALAMLIAFIMMQAQLTTFSKRRRCCRPPVRFTTTSPAAWGAFSPSPARCRPT